MEASNVRAVIPAVGVSLNIPVGDGPKAIGLVFQTHLPSDLSESEFNNRLDKFMEHARRQQIIGKIPDLEKDIDKFRFTIKNLEEDIDKLDKQAQEKYDAQGRTGTVKLRADEKAARDNALVNVSRYKEMLGDKERELAEAKSLRDVVAKGAAKAA
jgi:hypothetical protein